MTFVPKSKANECKVPSSNLTNLEHFLALLATEWMVFPFLLGQEGWKGPGGRDSGGAFCIAHIVCPTNPFVGICWPMF